MIARKWTQGHRTPAFTRDAGRSGKFACRLTDALVDDPDR